MSDQPIKVTATDPETGCVQTADCVPGDYVIICAEPLYVHYVNRYANGTVVLTLKRRAP